MSLNVSSSTSATCGDIDGCSVPPAAAAGEQRQKHAEQGTEQHRSRRSRDLGGGDLVRAGDSRAAPGAPQQPRTMRHIELPAHVPELLGVSVETATEIEGGWDYVVFEVNGAWIVRIPRRT